MKEINKILIDYHLQNYWEILRKKLNNYIHNNGSQFTVHNLIKYNNEHLEIFFKNINIRISYIVTFFLVLIIMIQGSLISSTDYTDYLDMRLKPPKNSQYEIAKFVQEYIDKKVIKLHPDLKQYLKDNNCYGMNII